MKGVGSSKARYGCFAASCRYPERFSHKFDQKGLHKTDKDGNWIKDEDLYQTARYITTRIYANIIVNDYAANFLGETLERIEAILRLQGELH